MDAFEYLSILISIVLGLALAQLLTDAGRLLLFLYFGLLLLQLR